MGTIAEIVWSAGIIALVAVFGIGKSDPIHSIVKVPVCEVQCSFEPMPQYPEMQVYTCNKVSTEAWVDMTNRVLDAGGYCGYCGTPTDCPKIKQFDEYK